MDDENLVQLQWFLSIVILILALIAGTKALLRQSAQLPSPKTTPRKGSRLLRGAKDGMAQPNTEAASPVVEVKAPASAEAAEGSESILEPSSHGFTRFRLAPRDLASASEWAPQTNYDNLWEVRNTSDAANLLAGCPMDTIIACSFHRAYAEHGSAQDRAMRQLAEAKPAGMAFATVDLQLVRLMIQAADVADWATVKGPEVRLLQPDGTLLERFLPAAVASGQLHRVAMVKAQELANEGMKKLELLALKFPGKDSLEKMKSAALDLVRDEVEMLEHLCQCVSSASVPRARHVASLARVIRKAGAAMKVLPLLDLSRRLASAKLLGGAEPGATEALERLLNAILLKFEMGERGAPFMLALQFVSNCFHQLGEALLPPVVELMSLPLWRALWQSGSDKWLDRCRDAAAQLLLNGSVVLRGARLRASHRPLLTQGLVALKTMPQDDRVNWAVGNLLAMGGGTDDAKETLQAQPLRSLRMLAAAIFNGQLDGPEGVAFPAAWHPPEDGAQRDGNVERRRPRAPIPGRHRRRSGG
eukprot:s737_g42.t2